MARKLLIVHEGTGTVIDLSDKVYLVDAADLTQDEIDYGRPVNPAAIGMRVDAVNMARIFFGDDV